MQFEFSARADREYKSLTTAVRRAADKQLDFLVRDLRHPSLHAKKYDETTGLWQGRITQEWRFYFLILSDLYYIVSIRKHPK